MTLLAALLLPLVAAQPRIINLSGSAAYKKVSLHWAVDNDGEPANGLFTLKFCENQIWGEHYCQERLLEYNPHKEKFSTDIYGRDHIHNSPSSVSHQSPHFNWELSPERDGDIKQSSS